MSEQEIVELSLQDQLLELEAQVLWYRSLVKSEGWVHLAKVLNGQAEQRAQQILGAFSMQAQNEGEKKDGVSSVLEAEFEKGVRVGLLMAKNLPEDILKFAEDMTINLRMQIMKEEQKGEVH